MRRSPTRRSRDEEGAGTPGRSRTGRILLALGLLCIGSAVALWRALPGLVEGLVLEQLRAAGVERASLRMEELSLHRAVIRSVALGDPPALAIDHVRVDYTPLGLLAGRLDRLEVSDATLRVVFTPEGASFGALDALLPGSEDAGAGAEDPAAPPFALGSVALRRARVAVWDGDRQVATFGVDAESQGPPDLDAGLAALRADVTAQLEADDLAWAAAPGVAAHGGLALHWSGAGGTLHAEALRVALRTADAETPWLASTLTLDAELSRDTRGVVARVRECGEVLLETLALGGVSLAAPIALCGVTGDAGLVAPPAEAESDALRFDLAFSSDAVLHLDLPAQGDAPSATLLAPQLEARGRFGAGGLESKLRLRGRRTELPAYRVAAAGLSLETDLAPQPGTTLAGHLDASGLEVGVQGEPVVLPFALVGDFSLEAGRLRFRAEGSEPRGLALRCDGQHDVVANTGHVDLELAPLRFSEQGLLPADVFPALRGWVERAGGAVSAKARLHWPAQGLGKLDLALEDLDLSSETLRVEGIDGVVRLAEVWPPRTEPSQFLTFDRLESGLSLTQGAVAFALEGDGSLDISAAEGLWAGGWLKAKGRIDPGAQRQEYALELKGIGLGPLSALTELEGLDATGRLTGTIPIYIEGRSVIIENARLEAGDAGGTIRYRPDEAPAALASAGQGGAFALEALRDFRYETLSLEVAGDADDALVVELRLSGRNPEVSPQPINLNFTVRGPLGSLAQDSLVGIWFPQRFIPALRGLRQVRSR